MSQKNASILGQHVALQKELLNELEKTKPKGMGGSAVTASETPVVRTLTPLCYTEAEAAAMLTINIAELIELRLTGKISYRQIGKNIRYTIADLEEYIERVKTRRRTVNY